MSRTTITLSPVSGDRITSRRICWPDPDATCLEGGCIWCNDYPFRRMDVIGRWVSRQGVLRNRAVGSKTAREAWQYGQSWGFFGVEKRVRS